MEKGLGEKQVIFFCRPVPLPSNSLFHFSSAHSSFRFGKRSTGGSTVKKLPHNPRTSRDVRELSAGGSFRLKLFRLSSVKLLPLPFKAIEICALFQSGQASSPVMGIKSSSTLARLAWTPATDSKMWQSLTLGRSSAVQLTGENKLEALRQSRITSGCRSR